jgi:hypothetical protein
MKHSKTLTARFHALAEYLKSLQDTSLNDFMALNEVGVITVIAVEFHEGNRCHHQVCLELYERLERACSKVVFDNCRARSETRNLSDSGESKDPGEPKTVQPRDPVTRTIIHFMHKKNLLHGK